MSNFEKRIEKLEARSAPPREIVVRYEDKTTPEELDALRADPGVILLVVKYDDRYFDEPK